MADETLTYKELAFPYFRNTRSLGAVSGVDLNVEDALRAALVTRSNILAVGGRGTGKTQAMSDISRHFFGGEGVEGKGVFIEGRADFKPDELFTRVNLDKVFDPLKRAASTEEIIELTSKMTKRFFGADELNRCPEITQNGFMALASGYYPHHGERIPLGNNDYSIAMATANIGNGEYSGTFRMDSALLDRWQLILDLDYWRKTADDENEIRKQRRDPRVKLAPWRDLSDKLVAAYKSIGQPSETMELISLYLTQGLDYCEKFPAAEHSKRVLDTRFPVICHEKSCALRNKACGIVKPLEERGAQTILRLAQGLEYIARLKNPEAHADPINSMLMAYSLVAPHSRVLSQQYILQEENFNNPALAGKHAAAKLRSEIEDLQKDGSPVFQAYVQAKYGGSHAGIDALDAKYAYLKPFLREITRS